MTNLSKSVRAALDGWYANEARGQTLDAWLEERLGPVGAVVTDVVREVDATHGEVTQASDRYRWLAGRIAGLRARVGDDTVDRLLGEETEASLAHAAIDGAAGARHFFSAATASFASFSMSSDFIAVKGRGIALSSTSLPHAARIPAGTDARSQKARARPPPWPPSPSRLC